MKLPSKGVRTPGNYFGFLFGFMNFNVRSFENCRQAGGLSTYLAWIFSSDGINSSLSVAGDGPRGRHYVAMIYFLVVLGCYEPKTSFLARSVWAFFFFFL